LSIRDELIGYMGGLITEHKRQLFEDVVRHRTNYLQVVLDEVDDPLDANAAFRSCECFGIQKVHWIQGQSGAKMSRGVAVGSTKWLDLAIYQAPAYSSCETRIRESGCRQFALSTGPDAMSIDVLPLDKPLALWFASETRGFPRAMRGEVDGFLRLPMLGAGHHFNFSVAVALTLQALTTRLRKEGHEWQLSDEERSQLILDWYATVPKRRQQIVARFLESKGMPWSVLAPPITSAKFWDLMGQPSRN